MYIYLLRRCDSSIGIGKAKRHHEFNNDEIGFCLVLGIVCHSIRGLYFGKYPPPPGGREKISADVIWGKKYEKAKRKKGKM
jgi:hypothetical protein